MWSACPTFPLGSGENTGVSIQRHKMSHRPLHICDVIEAAGSKPVLLSMRDWWLGSAAQI